MRLLLNPIHHYFVLGFEDAETGIIIQYIIWPNPKKLVLYFLNLLGFLLISLAHNHTVVEVTGLHAQFLQFFPHHSTNYSLFFNHCLDHHLLIRRLIAPLPCLPPLRYQFSESRLEEGAAFAVAEAEEWQEEFVIIQLPIPLPNSLLLERLYLLIKLLLLHGQPQQILFL